MVQEYRADTGAGVTRCRHPHLLLANGKGARLLCETPAGCAADVVPASDESGKRCRRHGIAGHAAGVLRRSRPGRRSSVCRGATCARAGRRGFCPPEAPGRLVRREQPYTAPVAPTLALAREAICRPFASGSRVVEVRLDGRRRSAEALGDLRHRQPFGLAQVPGERDGVRRHGRRPASKRSLRLG